MNELREILKAWRSNRQAPGVLATVVHVEGSAYRRPGARMLIGNDNLRIGTISGGCLEGDVARKAAWWTAEGNPVIRIYDTMSDEDAAWEFGLGCQGVIHVLLERMESAGAQAMLAYLDACHAGRAKGVIATVVRASRESAYRTGDHFLGLEGMPAEIAARARDLRRNCLLRIAGAEIFLEWVVPPQRIVIFGAGHDAVPVVSAAAALGWDAVVADVRSGYAKPDRFPGAAAVVTLPPSGSIDGRVEIDRDTAVVLMTHNMPLDVTLLPQVLACEPRYLGLLGPWKRTERLYASAGYDSPREASPNLHAPIGLDLGGDTPESIAIAIIAEIQAVLQGRSGGHLRLRRDAIHPQVEEVGVPQDIDVAPPAREAAVCER